MANEQWQERVQRAQQMAAERLGIDVSTMQPPRQPGVGGASAEAAEAEPAVEAQPAPAQAEAVSEPAPAAATAQPSTPEPAGATAAAPSSAAAQRIADAKARAAAKTQASNGGATAAAPIPATPAAPAARTAAPVARPAAAATATTAESEEVGQPGINRREFLTYAWGAALGLLTLETGVASYFFMYPRFRAGEFGGKFILGEARILPPTTAGPDGNATGKFWLVNTDQGPVALYMVCTHLGCLYKWEPSNFRFECPCHASKFTRDGHYIEGPASRSLDQFIVEVVENGEVVATTTDVGDEIVPPPVPGPNAELVVDTGRRIVGKPAAISPALAGKGLTST